MSGIRIDIPVPLKDSTPINVSYTVAGIREKFPEIFSGFAQVEKAVNSIVTAMQAYKIGEVPLCKILNANGKQIGWIGIDGASTGIAIDTLRPYATGANIGTGKVTTPAAITAAATNTLTVGTDDQVQEFFFQAGAGAYTYNIDLDYTGAFEGAVFWLKINKDATTNPTITIRDGAAGVGGTFASINNANAENYCAMFVYEGSRWVKMLLLKNDY